MDSVGLRQRETDREMEVCGKMEMNRRRGMRDGRGEQRNRR